MPNHTPNLLSIVGERNIKKLLKPYLTQDENELGEKVLILDLDKIVPMPKEIEQSTKYGNMEYLMRKRTKAQENRMRLKQEKHEKMCLERYGAKSWYDWCIQYWGTKWNTYENRFYKNDDGDECLYFQTAWSPPEPALRELAKKLGKIVRVSYMDEGYAFFGTYHFYPDGNVDDECYQDHKLVPDELCEELGIDTYYSEECEEERELAQKG